MALRRIVVVSRQAEIHQLARQVAQETFVADDLADALDITKTVNPDLVVFDNQFSPPHIREFLNILLKHNRNSMNIPVVAVGNGESDTDLSAEFIQAGAVDCLKGKQDYGRLQHIAGRIKNKSNTIDSAGSETDPNYFFADKCAASVFMVGRSKAILSTVKMIKLVAASRCNPALILGETGTGKELAAKAIHALRHPDEPFVAVNCAALTANLLESELFGHVKGSFTGADREKTGLLEVAGNGTLFLDEISEMPIGLQAKLLRVLQEKTFRKVGGIKNITCDATITASSNRDLESQVRTNCFRRDLYYRLNICPITIAPLRAPQRREDVQLLAEYFLSTSTICPEKCNKITSFTKLAMDSLQKHDWPGNVRELSNVIERAIILETTDKIGLSGIVINPGEWEQPSDGLTTGHIKNFSLAEAERQLIARALQETGWQKTRAAALLGITRATLYAKVKQYNIERGSYIADDHGTQKNTFSPSSREVQNEPLTSSTPQPVTAA